MSQLELTSNVFPQAVPALVWANQECVSLMVQGWVSLQHLKAGRRGVYCSFLHGWHLSVSSRLGVSQVRSGAAVGVRARLFEHKGFTQDPVGGEWPLCHCKKILETVKRLQITTWFAVLPPYRRTASLRMGWKGFLEKLKRCSWWDEETSEKIAAEAAGVCGTLWPLLAASCFGGQNGTQTWYQLSVLLSEQFLERQFLLTCVGELGGAAEESGFGRSFAKLLNF